MQSEDFVIIMTDVRPVQDNGKKKVKFRIQVPGRVSGGQETEYDDDKLSDMLYGWENETPSLPQVLEVGKFLGEALFPSGLIRDAFLTSLATHKEKVDSRLRLILIPQGELHDVPWEFALFHTEKGEATQNEILGLMSQVSIVRQLDRTLPARSTKAAALPAQMVMALANPKGTPKLFLGKERTFIEQGIGKSERVQVTYVEPATFPNLLGGKERVDLFHFAGHGVFSERPTPGPTFGVGALVLDDGLGGADERAAPLLAKKLVEAGVRVAVLGACLSGKRDQVNLWSSTAANLVNGGIGAVIGMQFVVKNSSAEAFSKAFYEALALGYPVDQAVTKGRLAIFEKGDYRGFGTPVLYMGGSDGVVFPEFTQDPVLQAEREKTRVVVNLSADIVEGKVTGIHVGTMRGGEANATLTFIELKEGSEVIGFEADSLTSGNVEVNEKAKVVGKGATLFGAKLDSLG